MKHDYETWYVGPHDYPDAPVGWYATGARTEGVGPFPTRADALKAYVDAEDAAIAEEMRPIFG